MGSLRSLTILFLVAFGVATVLTGYATYSASHLAIVRSVDRRIETIGSLMLSEVHPGDARSILSRIDAFSRRRENGDIGFELEDAEGRRLGGNVVLSRKVPFGFSTLHPGDGITGLSAGRAQMRDAGGGLRLITIAETEPIDGYDAVRIRNYLLGFGLIALVVLAGTATFSLLIRRRIAEVRATAEAIIDGDMDRRVPVTRHGGVFDDQAATFNRMLDRIAVLVESLRNIGGDVAHDLRTPLNRLHGRLTRIADQSPSPDAEAALAQCDELLAMFAAILRIAEVEGSERRAAFGPVDLAGIAETVADSLTDAAGESGHRLTVTTVTDAQVDGDRQLISQAAYNLVENALRHTPAGSSIRLIVAREGRHVVLRICDDGPGIAAGDRALALRRFGRLDASRNRPGQGLGLPLVDAVARLHRGTFTLEDAAPGLSATLSFPA